MCLKKSKAQALTGGKQPVSLQWQNPLFAKCKYDIIISRTSSNEYLTLTSMEYLFYRGHFLKILYKSYIFQGDIKENASGCFLSGHSVLRPYLVKAVSFYLQPGRFS